MFGLKMNQYIGQFMGLFSEAPSPWLLKLMGIDKAALLHAIERETKKLHQLSSNFPGHFSLINLQTKIIQLLNSLLSFLLSGNLTFATLFQCLEYLNRLIQELDATLSQADKVKRINELNEQLNALLDYQKALARLKKEKDPDYFIALLHYLKQQKFMRLIKKLLSLFEILQNNGSLYEFESQIRPLCLSLGFESECLDESDTIVFSGIDDPTQRIEIIKSDNEIQIQADTLTPEECAFLACLYEAYNRLQAEADSAPAPLEACEFQFN